MLPFASVYLSDWLQNPHATGFVQIDMPYYVANGREIFERGNGILYPNPYDPAPGAPVIYFHWFLWLVGFGIAHLGLDPGGVFVALGALGALLFARLTLTLVGAVLDDERFLARLYLGVMWGGGVLCLGRVVENLVAGRGPGERLLWHDPASGRWFLSWGRNAVYPTEVVYHVLSALIFVSLLRRRWTVALWATAALAATHPWSGVELIAIVGVWATLSLVRRPARAELLHWLGSVALAAAFGAYYFVYLPSFPEHRALSDYWLQDFSMPFASALLGYGPVALLAAARLWVDRRALDARVGFLLVAFGVAFALVEHDLFLDPVQPLHFTRGYVWLPLCLIALPLVQRALISASRRWRPALFAGVSCALLLVASADNLAVLGTGIAFGKDLGIPLSPAERDVFRWLDERRLDGVLLCHDPRLGYLSATYTHTRPYSGHINNTPNALLRLKQIRRWEEGRGVVPWDPPVDYVLVRRAEALAPPAGCEWSVLYENEEDVLYGRAE